MWALRGRRDLPGFRAPAEGGEPLPAQLAHPARPPSPALPREIWKNGGGRKKGGVFPGQQLNPPSQPPDPTSRTPIPPADPRAATAFRFVVRCQEGTACAPASIALHCWGTPNATRRSGPGVSVRAHPPGRERHRGPGRFCRARKT